jgi:hypothetical protein
MILAASLIVWLAQYAMPIWSKSMAGIRTYLESLNARSEIKCINLTLTNQGTVNLYRPFSIEIDHVVGAVSDQSQKRRCVTYQAIAVIDTN